MPIPKNFMIFIGCNFESSTSQIFFLYFEGKKRRHGVWTAWFIVKWFTVADFLDAQSNTTVYRFSQLDGGVCCQALWKRYLEELFHYVLLNQYEQQGALQR